MGQDDISLVSTTDSPEDVQAALTGKPAAPPAEPAKPAEPAAAPAAAAASPAAPAESAPVADATPAADAKPAAPAAPETAEQRDARLETERKATVGRRVNRIQSQIDELTKQKHDVRRDVEGAQARKDALALEIAELERKKTALGGAAPDPATPAPGTPAATPVVDVAKDPRVVSARQVLAALGAEPKLDDTNADGSAKFSDYEAFVSAVGKYNRAYATAEAKVAQAEESAALRFEQSQADRARVEREQANREQQETLALYSDKIEEFKQRAPDFDTVIEGAREFIEELGEERGPQVLQIVDGFTTVDAENGPAIQYHLAQHPEELRQIVALPARQQLAALARLDARLGAALSTPAQRPATPVTRAPEPIKPVGGAPTASTVSPEDDDYRAYAARRNREERERAAAGAR